MNLEDPIALLLFIFILLGFFSLLETSNLKPLERIFRIAIHATLYTLNAALVLLLLEVTPNPAWNPLRLSEWSPSLQFFTALFILDFFSYVFHRLSHRFQTLWYFHQVHHSDPYVETTTALRIHVVQMLLHLIPECLILTILKPERDVYLLYLICNHSFVLFHHSRILIPQGAEKILSYLLITPRVHHQHHSLALWQSAPNFGSLFSFWDRLFKSFAFNPLPNSYGLPQVKNAFTLSELFIPKFRKMDLIK